jgi:hypothetical protein
MLILLTSVASAEVYKWEDANGMHYTDSPGSVPEKYREKVYEETREQIRNSKPQSSNGSTQRINQIQSQENQAAIYQANIEQQRRAVALQNQQQARALAVSTKNVEGAFLSLARFLVLWILVGMCVFIAWISTIVDIVRSEFTNPSNKSVWMMLVIFIPLLGMLLYYLVGLGQKSNSVNSKDKQQEELLARLKPRDPADKNFVI